MLKRVYKIGKSGNGPGGGWGYVHKSEGRREMYRKFLKIGIHLILNDILSNNTDVFQCYCTQCTCLVHSNPLTLPSHLFSKLSNYLICLVWEKSSSALLIVCTTYIASHWHIGMSVVMLWNTHIVWYNAIITHFLIDIYNIIYLLVCMSSWG